MTVGMAVVGNSKNLYDSALWLRTFKDATTKKHLGRKGIRTETYKRDCNAHRYVLPSAGESSRGFLVQSINGNLMNPL